MNLPPHDSSHHPFGTFGPAERPKNCGPGIASYTGHRELRRRCPTKNRWSKKSMGKMAMIHETHVGCFNMKRLAGGNSNIFLFSSLFGGR